MINAVKKLGGSTNPLTLHTHIQNSHWHWTGTRNANNGFIRTVGWYGSGGGSYLPTAGVGEQASNSDPNVYGTLTETITATNQNTGDNTNHNNWQPFMAVYIWVRTS